MTKRIQSWHLWPARNWPFNAQEESEFVADLEDLSDDVELPRAERAGITAVANALRCGASVAELLTFLPGTRPEVLLSAYRHVEERRTLAEEAWTAIVKDGTVEAIREHGPVAARLAPVPTMYLLGLVSYVDPSRVPESVAKIEKSISRVRKQVTEVEHRLRMLPSRDEGTRLYARQIYDPNRPGLWSHQHFVPERVGELTPVRLADVLGERR
jgi:hypothetical protein